MFPYLQQQNIQNVFNLNVLPCAINGCFIKYMEMSPLLLRTFYDKQRHLMVIYYFAANSAWDLRHGGLRRILQAGTLLRIQ